MKKLFILLAVIAVTATNVNAKNYLAFKKPQAGGTDTKEIFQDGKAMQISTKPNSVVVLCVEKTEVGCEEMNGIVSVALVENAPETTFDPEQITCTVSDGKKETTMGVRNPENYQLYQEKKAKQAKKLAAWGNALGGLNGGVNATAGALNTMNATNNYKDQMASISQSANECLQISTLSVGGVNQAAGKVIFFPSKGKVGKYQTVKIVVTVGDEVHEFVFGGSIVKI